MRRTIVAPAIASVLLAVTSPAEADPTFIAGFSDGMATITDLRTGEDVMSPNTRETYNAGDLTPEYDFRIAPNGYDLTVTLTNNTSDRRVIGHLTAAGFWLGQVIDYVDLRYDTKIDQFDHEGQNFFGAAREYPRSLYSPAAIFGDERYWVGVSVQYPIVEYLHPISLMIRSPGGSRSANGRNWEVDVNLSGSIQPGESRTYTLSVRVVDRDEQWVKTLLPYRDWFHKTYGRVSYPRDPRPVKSYNVANRDYLSESNPNGFANFLARPDLYGWEPIVDYMRDIRFDTGHERLMVWAPTGLHRINTQLNFPYKFMTHMQDDPDMWNTRHLLANVASPPNFELGFWWGRSTQVMRNWDENHWEPMDPNNPEHVALGFAELDLAVEAGATMIGLDAFVYARSVGDAFTWLTMLRQRAPNVKFVVEPAPADIIHFQAGAFTYAANIESPHLIADFLLPGHESWAQIRFDVLEDELNRPLTPEEMDAEIDRVRRLGFIPVIGGAHFRTRPMLSEDSWRRTMDDDIRQEAPVFNTNYEYDDVLVRRNGRVALIMGAGPDAPDGEAQALNASAPADESSRRRRPGVVAVAGPTRDDDRPARRIRAVRTASQRGVVFRPDNAGQEAGRELETATGGGHSRTRPAFTNPEAIADALRRARRFQPRAGN